MCVVCGMLCGLCVWSLRCVMCCACRGVYGGMWCMCVVYAVSVMCGVCGVVM